MYQDIFVIVIIIIVFKVFLIVTFIINHFYWSFIIFVLKITIVLITVDIVLNIRVNRIISIVVSIIGDRDISVVYRANAIATEMMLLLK